MRSSSFSAKGASGGGCSAPLFPAGAVAALADLLRHHRAVRLPKSPQDLSPYAMDRVAAQTEIAYQELIALKRRAVTIA